MAEIKVNIKGDDSDVKAKFKETSAEARRFEESVKTSLETVNASGKTLVSETGLGGILKLFGAAGLVGSAEEFTSRIIDGFKSAVGAALDFQGQVGKIRSALGPAFAGQAEGLVNWVESVSAAFGGLEKNLPIFEALLRGKMMPEEAKKALVEIQNAAKATGSDIEELGMAFAEMKERGEVPERFWKQFPQLAPIAQGLGGGEHPSAQWMLGTFLPSIAPGGFEAPGRIRAQMSIGGQMATNQEELNKAWRELGQDLLPLVNASLKELKEAMPEVTSEMKALGAELQKDVPQVAAFIHDFFGGTHERLEHPTTAFGRGFKTVDDYFAGVEKKLGEVFTGSADILREAAAEQKAAAADLHRVVNPK